MNDSNQAAVKEHIPALDMLRGVAIILVFLWDYRQGPCPKWVSAVGQFGWSGADLFFVLSGYLISVRLMQELQESNQINFKRFFVGRFFRIIPCYLVIISLYFLFPWFNDRAGLPALWRFLTFTQNFGVELAHHGSFSHALSLCVEAQFYLLFPLLLAGISILRRRIIGPVVIGTVFVAGLIIRRAVWQANIVPLQFSQEWLAMNTRFFESIFYPTYCRVDGLLAGIIIAGVQCYKPDWWRILALRASFLLIAGLAILFVNLGSFALVTFHGAVFGFPLVALGYGLVVLYAISSQFVFAKLSLRSIDVLASLAFCIYLTHKPLIAITRVFLECLSVASDSNIMFIGCILVSLFGGLCLNMLVELPFLRVSQQLIGRFYPQKMPAE